MYKKTERMIFEYFQANKNIAAKLATIATLDAKITELDRRMRTTDITLPEQSFGSSWGDPMGSGGSNSSYSDRAIDKIIDSMEREVYAGIELINQLEEDIRTIEWLNTEIDYHYNLLDKDSQTLLFLKYDKKMTDFDVGEEMHMSQSQTTKMKRKLIMDVMDWNILGMKKECTTV